MNSGYEVDKEGEDVEREDKGNCPFEDSACVGSTPECAYGESNCQCDFNQDERELDPERSAKHPVFAEMYFQTLVLPTDENGRKNIPSNEQEQEDIMKPRMVESIKNTKQDEPGSTDERKDQRDTGQNLFNPCGISRQSTSVP